MTSAKAILLLTISATSSVTEAFQPHPTTSLANCSGRGLITNPLTSTTKRIRSSAVVDAIVRDAAPSTTTSTTSPECKDDSRRSFLSSLVSTSSIIAAASASSFCAASPTIAAEESIDPTIAATYAFRSAGLPSLRTLGLSKLLTRYEGSVLAPENFNVKGVPKRDLKIQFDFPSDWLQLDKLSGGIQYVDQRNGDKLYVLHAVLPEDVTLKSVEKSWFGNVIFHPKGDVVRSGVVVDGYRVTRSQMLNDCSSNDGESDASDTNNICYPRRRLLLKYDTVTGSGVQTVERRGLVDAQQVGERDVYMMLTASNAVKFEAKGSKERETVENIVDSFTIG